MATPSRSQLKLFWRLHRWLFQVSDGRLGKSIGGHKVLKLTTTGHRSGEPRAILIWYFPYENRFVIVASNAGYERHPAWYLNLQAQPAAEIQIGQKHIDVRARTAEGEERERLWSQITNEEESFVTYQDQTERQIPVVILDPVAVEQP